MPKCKCKLCGYIYDPEEGDPRNKVEVGTEFEDLPERWCCPSCGIKKKSFEPI